MFVGLQPMFRYESKAGALPAISNVVAPPSVRADRETFAGGLAQRDK